MTPEEIPETFSWSLARPVPLATGGNSAPGADAERTKTTDFKGLASRRPADRGALQPIGDRPVPVFPERARRTLSVAVLLGSLYLVATVGAVVAGPAAAQATTPGTKPPAPPAQPGSLWQLSRQATGIWSRVDVTQAAQATPLSAVSDPTTDPSNGAYTTFGIGSPDNHILQLSRLSGKWQRADVTANAAGSPVGHVSSARIDPSDGRFTLFGSGYGNGHVLQISRDLHGRWHQFDVTASAAATGATAVKWVSDPMTDPVSKSFAVFTVSAIDDHIVELGRQANGTWRAKDVSAAAGITGALSVSEPEVDPGTRLFALFAVANNGDLLELSEHADGTWHAYDITHHATGSPAASVSSPGRDPASGDYSVFCVGFNGHILQFSRSGSGWQQSDVTAAAGGKLVTLVSDAIVEPGTEQLAVFAVGDDGQALQMTRVAGTWSEASLTGSGTGQKVLGAADPAIDPGSQLLDEFIVVAAYENPLRSLKGLSTWRIDQGVDYGGSGPIYALGIGTVLNVTNAGWPNGVFIAYQLTSGPASGDVVDAAEGITPWVKVGQAVDPETAIGTVFAGSSGIETGWADPKLLGQSLAYTYEQWDGTDSSALGENFNHLLVALGAPGGTTVGTVNDGTLKGGLPPGWPTW